MRIDIPINTTDIIVLTIVGILMILGVIRTVGFFREKKPRVRLKKGETLIQLQIRGMMCGQCEAHINNTIRNHFSVKKVSSSHTAGTAQILTDAQIDDESLKKAIADTGYEVLDITRLTA